MKINKLTSSIQKDMTTATYVDGSIGIFSSQLSKIVYKDSDGVQQKELTFPQEWTSLDGWGQSSLDGIKVNTLDISNKVYHKYGKYVNGEWVDDVADITVTSTIDTPFDVEGGGTLQFRYTDDDKYVLAVPNTEEYTIKLSEVTT